MRYVRTAVVPPFCLKGKGGFMTSVENSLNIFCRTKFLFREISHHSFVQGQVECFRISIIGFASIKNKSQGVQTFESISIIYSGTESWLQVQVFSWRRSFSYCVLEMCFVVLIMSCISNSICQICNVGNISPVTLCWTMFILSNHG